MFYSATAFNSSLLGWSLSSLTDASYVFSRASSFNQPFQSWGENLGSVTFMSYMFSYAGAFNRDLTNWNIRSSNSMVGMFDHADNFNGDISM